VSRTGRRPIPRGADDLLDVAVAPHRAEDAARLGLEQTRPGPARYGSAPVAAAGRRRTKGSSPEAPTRSATSPISRTWAGSRQMRLKQTWCGRSSRGFAPGHPRQRGERHPGGRSRSPHRVQLDSREPAGGREHPLWQRAADNHRDDIYGNDPTSNCGILNGTTSPIDARETFWGGPTGPGADPADLVCERVTSASTLIDPVAHRARAD
jgi:hypothetical protein